MPCDQCHSGKEEKCEKKKKQCGLSCKQIDCITRHVVQVMLSNLGATGTPDCQGNFDLLPYLQDIVCQTQCVSPPPIGYVMIKNEIADKLVADGVLATQETPAEIVDVEETIE